MKAQKKISKNLPVVAEAVTPEVVAPLDNIDEPDYNTPSERVRYHIGMAQHHGRQALAHLILAGWELSKQKQAIGYGGWEVWCEGNLQISKDTADRYIQFYQKTVGEARNAAEIPLAKKPTIKELSAATVGMEQKSATRAMIDLNIIRRTKDWGGKREGAGHPKKDEDEVAAEEVVALDAAANAGALLMAAIREPLEKIYKAWRESDVFARIDMQDLAVVTATLNELAAAATAALKARSK